MDLINRPLVGYIFRHHSGKYYAAYHQGTKVLKSEAHIYTNKELRLIARKDADARKYAWGGKATGTWLIVYGQS